jgi:hypothetical protein
MFFIHAIRGMIRTILIVFVVLFLALFIWLKLGIKLDRFIVAGYTVNGLYIKLDKRFIVTGERLILPHRKTAPSLSNIDTTFDRVKYLFTFFDYIELKDVEFKNDTLTMVFADDVLYITSNQYEIAGNIHRVGKKFEAEVSLLYLKKDDVRITGTLQYNFQTDHLSTKGEFDAFRVRGRFVAQKRENRIDFSLQSDTFSDLHPLIAKFELNDTVKAWILDKVQAQQYTLLELSGRANIQNKQFKIEKNTLKAKGLFTDCRIHFKENVAPVLTPHIVLRYEDDGLFFDLQEPLYEGKSLEGSTVSILNVSDANTTLNLDLRFDTPFDATLQALLQAYKLHIPVLQESGKMDARFRASLGLKDDREDFLVDANLSKGVVQINTIKLPVEKGTLHYKKGAISLEGMVLKDSLYEAEVEGIIHLAQQKADLMVNAKTIALEAKGQTFFSLKNETFPIQLEYKNDLLLLLPKFSTKITQSKEKMQIDMTDLSALKPYLFDPEPLSEGGSVSIKTNNFKDFSFEGVLKRSSCVLYEKEENCQVRVPFSATLTPSDFNFYAFDRRVHYDESKSRLKLQDINIDLEKFLATQPKQSSKERKKLLILGKNSHLRHGDYTLLTDSYDVELEKNGDIKALGSADGDIVKFSKTNEVISIQALRIKDRVLHRLINFEGLYAGRYTFKGQGVQKKIMKGEIIVEGGVMKDFKAYNNTLALINTLPDLAVLHNPGFSQKGFSIEEGVVEYRVIEQKHIIFDSIYIKGATATVVGKGEIDLEKKTITIDLAIQIARNLGKLIGNLPLVGYIVMGENKSLTVGLKITGDLDKPVVNTSAAKEILTLPLQIVKRTLEAPSKLIQKKP